MFVHGIDDCNKLILQGSTSDKEPIDIRLIDKLSAVGITDGSTVDNPGGSCNLLVNLLGQPLPDLVVDFLGLCSGCRESSANSPNWFVGD